MKKQTAALSILLASLLAVTGAVQAQGTSASSTSNVPLKAGEASTTTQGVPNAQTNNPSPSGTGASGSTGMSGSTGLGSSSSAATGRTGSAAGTSSVPTKAGEASTTVKGQPDANPDSPMINKTAEERRTEREMKSADRKMRREAAVMGQKGAKAGAPAGTPAVSPAGNPSVFKGGTPK